MVDKDSRGKYLTRVNLRWGKGDPGSERGEHLLLPIYVPPNPAARLSIMLMDRDVATKDDIVGVATPIALSALLSKPQRFHDFFRVNLYTRDHSRYAGYLRLRLQILPSPDFSRSQRKGLMLPQRPYRWAVPEPDDDDNGGDPLTAEGKEAAREHEEPKAALRRRWSQVVGAGYLVAALLVTFAAFWFGSWLMTACSIALALTTIGMVTSSRRAASQRALGAPAHGRGVSQPLPPAVDKEPTIHYELKAHILEIDEFQEDHSNMIFTVSVGKSIELELAAPFQVSSLRTASVAGLGEGLPKNPENVPDIIITARLKTSGTLLMRSSSKPIAFAYLNAAKELTSRSSEPRWIETTEIGVSRPKSSGRVLMQVSLSATASPLEWPLPSTSKPARVSVFVCQGRRMPMADSDGLCDPLLRITFRGQTKTTTVRPKTRNPIWYQVLEFGDMELPFAHALTALSVELLDRDQQMLMRGNKDEHLSSTNLRMGDVQVIYTTGDASVTWPDDIWFHELEPTSKAVYGGAVQLAVSVQWASRSDPHQEEEKGGSPIKSTTRQAREIPINIFSKVGPPSITVRQGHVRAQVLGVRDLRPDSNLFGKGVPRLMFEIKEAIFGPQSKSSLASLKASTSAPRFQSTTRSPNYFETVELSVALSQNPALAPVLECRLVDERIGGGETVIGRGHVKLGHHYPASQSSSDEWAEAPHESYKFGEALFQSVPLFVIKDRKPHQVAVAKLTVSIEFFGNSVKIDHVTGFADDRPVPAGYAEGAPHFSARLEGDEPWRVFQHDSESGSVKLFGYSAYSASASSASPPEGGCDEGEDALPSAGGAVGGGGNGGNSEAAETAETADKQAGVSSAEGAAGGDGDGDGDLDEHVLASANLQTKRERRREDHIRSLFRELEDRLAQALAKDKKDRAKKAKKASEESQRLKVAAEVGLRCIARVYIQTASQLVGDSTRMNSGSNDIEPYLRASMCGKRVEKYECIKARENGDPLNPEFFTVLELEVTLPGDAHLVLDVMDNDPLSRDQFLGAVVLDLEDRLYDTNYEPGKLPVACPPPEAEVHDLRMQNATKIAGGAGQLGQLSLWIDVVSADSAQLREAVPHDPPLRTTYEVRVIVYSAHIFNCNDFTGMCDLFFKCSLQGGNKEETDTHFRLEEGMTGSFNWRFLFEVDVPLQGESFRHLMIEAWDANLGFSNLIGDVSIDLSLMLQEAMARQASAGGNQMMTLIEPIRLFRAPKPTGATPKQDSNENEGEEEDADDWWDHLYSGLVHRRKPKREDKVQEEEERSHQELKKKKSKKKSGNAVMAAALDTVGLQPPTDTADLPLRQRRPGHSPVDTGDVRVSVALLPKQVADLPAFNVGKGRGEPNRFPIMRQPEGRIDAFNLFNPIYLIRKLLGQKISTGIFGVLVTILSVLVFFFAGDKVQAAIGFIDLVPYNLGWTCIRVGSCAVVFMMGRGGQALMHAAASKSNEESDDDDDDELNLPKISPSSLSGILLEQGPPVLLLYEVSALFPTGIKLTVRVVLKVLLLLSVWFTFYIVYRAKRSPPYFYELPRLLLPPYFSAFTVTRLLPKTDSMWQWLLPVLVLLLASFLCVVCLIVIVINARQRDRRIRRRAGDRMRLVGAALSKAAPASESDIKARCNSLNRVIIAIVVLTTMTCGEYAAYYGLCDGDVGLTSDVDGDIVLQCDGEEVWAINPHDVAVKLKHDALDAFSELVERTFVAVEPLLFDGAEEVFSKYQTTLDLMISAGRCPGKRDSNVRACAKLTRKNSCENAHMLWSGSAAIDNKSIDGTDRMCCGGEWYCASADKSGTGSRKWFSHESMLLDAIDRALRKKRCDLGNLMQPKTKKGNRTKNGNKTKKGSVSMPVRLRTLKDPVLASFQCSGRIADTHMACIWYKGACHSSSAHTCHFCEDDEAIFT